jgi:RNA-directed DNA polymerase
MSVFPRYNGPSLMDQVVDVGNLTAAWRHVRSNIRLAQRDRSAGADQVTIHDFEADWVRQMQLLVTELRDNTYRPLPARMVNIPKRSGGERVIGVLTIRDRVAQRAVQQVLQPVFDPYFLDCSYGSRPAIGVSDALSRVERYADQGLRWVVDADIASYFDSIDHQILLTLVRHRVHEPAILTLIQRWLDAGSLQHDEAAPLRDDGVGLGRYTSRVGGAMRDLVMPSAGCSDDGSWSDYDDGSRGAAQQLPSIATLMGLAQAAWSGARQMKPIIDRIGGRRLAIGGAVAAGTVLLLELGLRAHAAASRPRGTLQGGALSPLLANIYLHPFDVAISTRGMRLVRYVDDFVVMCATRADAEQALSLVTSELANVRLQVQPDKTRIVALDDGIEFLGERVMARRGTTLPRPTGFADAERALRSAQAGLRWPRRPAESGRRDDDSTAA